MDKKQYMLFGLMYMLLSANVNAETDALKDFHSTNRGLFLLRR